MQVGDALCQLTHSNMSTSDSDYSIDWLASDEDDRDGSPLHPEEPSSSSSSSSEAAASSCTSCLLSTAQRKRRRRRRRSEDGDSVLSPVQGFTSVCSSVSVEAELPSNRKRTHKDEGHRAENELFSHKCAELQCYIQPLSSILRGLRSGRYSERLSSFQESVAMDRIQRIMGVLLNPCMGGHFLSIILKIAEMLQSWFPHIRPNSPTDDSTSAKRLKQHRSAASPPPSASTSPPPVFYQAAPGAAPCRPAAVVCSSSSSSRLGVTQDNAVSSSTDSKTGPPHRHKGAPLPLKISSPCLERLLQTKDSIIASRADGDVVWW